MHPHRLAYFPSSTRIGCTEYQCPWSYSHKSIFLVEEPHMFGFKAIRAVINENFFGKTVNGIPGSPSIQRSQETCGMYNPSVSWADELYMFEVVVGVIWVSRVPERMPSSDRSAI